MPELFAEGGVAGHPASGPAEPMVPRSAGAAVHRRTLRSTDRGRRRGTARWS
ncbi:hypothetical protein ACFPM0_25605 [Pseudonocardia sulfidoxydans]|uniref:hypothetical protein n=1 Tax=Pseudonocardia sulfidoxydans TaxID=54011 RepID=UPI00361A8498